MSTKKLKLNWNRSEGSAYPLEQCFYYDQIEGNLLDYSGNVEGSYTLKVLRDGIHDLLYTDYLNLGLSVQPCVNFEITKTWKGTTQTVQWAYPIKYLQIPRVHIETYMQQSNIDNYDRAMKVLG